MSDLEGMEQILETQEGNPEIEKIKKALIKLQKNQARMDTRRKHEFGILRNNEIDDPIDGLRKYQDEFNQEEDSEILLIEASSQGQRFLEEYEDEFDKEKEEILSVLFSSLLRREDESRKRIATRLFLRGELDKDYIEEFYSQKRLRELEERREKLLEIS